jgi:hypothetical protein
MHTRHEQLFKWLFESFGGRLYGPYDHGGRKYFQWMLRGRELREQMIPLLVRSRIESMCARYSIPLAPAASRPSAG